MSYLPWRRYLLEVARGNVAGASLVNKFGRNENVGTSLEPVTMSGNYQTPTSAQSLEVLSDDAQDDHGTGTGAWELTVQGLDASWDLQEVTVDLNGTAAVAISGTWFRVFRAYVSEAGSYANQTTPSQLGTITIRGSGGGATWVQIDEIDAGFGAGQTEIGVYTVPNGKEAYLLGYHASVDTNKTGDIYLFQRPNADDVSSPYSGAMRVVEAHVGISGEYTGDREQPLGPFAAKTDIGFMSKFTASGGIISVSFQIILYDV